MEGSGPGIQNQSLTGALTDPDNQTLKQGRFNMGSVSSSWQNSRLSLQKVQDPVHFIN